MEEESAMLKSVATRSGIVMLVAVASAACWADDGPGYPVKPIRMVIALAPGGGVDTSGRLLGQKFTEAWGQQVVAENRPGAGGTIATELVARAAPDGYTLLMQSMSHAITPALYKLPYDSIRDFAPVTLFVQSPSVLAVHPSLPAKSVKELITFAKAHPDEILFSSSGSGSGQHLAMELLKRMAGIRLVHVTY
jgi:tripartite-type tricarboxylate transporter receptor subunit TctC